MFTRIWNVFFLVNFCVQYVVIVFGLSFQFFFRARKDFWRFDETRKDFFGVVLGYLFFFTFFKIIPFTIVFFHERSLTSPSLLAEDDNV